MENDDEGCVIVAGGREVALSHPDKVLFPADGITKRDLGDYYARIAEVALPHYRGRPLSMERYPDGIGEDGFFQKHTPDHFPGWIARAELEKEDGTVTHVLIEEAATLVYLANQGMITPHLGLSRVDRIDRPDRLVFDLDPSDGDFAKVQDAARWLRGMLEEMDAAPFVQTTGSRGLHVVVPLDRAEDFDTVREAARQMCEVLAARHPETLTNAQRKKDRGGRVYLDIARNAYGQTSVAPYGVRARAHAPIATPLDWDEALSPDMTPQKYTIANIFRRLGAKDDPWAGIADAATGASALVRRAGELSPP